MVQVPLWKQGIRYYVSTALEELHTPAGTIRFKKTLQLKVTLNCGHSLFVSQLLVEEARSSADPAGYLIEYILGHHSAAHAAEHCAAHGEAPIAPIGSPLQAMAAVVRTAKRALVLLVVVPFLAFSIVEHGCAVVLFWLGSVLEWAGWNLPGDRVHHIDGGYGRLVAPWLKGQWLIWFLGSKKYTSLPRGLRLKDDKFHNCRLTGVN